MGGRLNKNNNKQATLSLPARPYPSQPSPTRSGAATLGPVPVLIFPSRTLSPSIEFWVISLRLLAPASNQYSRPSAGRQRKQTTSDNRAWLSACLSICLPSCLPLCVCLLDHHHSRTGHLWSVLFSRFDGPDGHYTLLTATDDERLTTQDGVVGRGIGT